LSSAIPDDAACIRMHLEEGSKRSIIEHVCTVRMIAMAMGKRSGADLRLVSAGALLHDIGRSKTQGLFHVVEGVRIARQRGLPEPLIQIIQRHIGAGFTWEEAKAMGLPEGDYMPQTLEEKIVCHADNLVKGAGGMQTLAEAEGEILRRGFPVTAERMRAMHQELSRACGADVDRIVLSLREKPDLSGPCAEYTYRPNARP